MDLSQSEFTTAASIARAVRAKQISPVEVVDATLARIEERNPSLNAFVHVDPQNARAAARRLERKVLDGKPVGPLAGVPTAIKDLFMTYPGWPETFGGIRAFRTSRADRLSHYPHAMEAADAIVVGMTNSPVLGFRGICDNPLYGATRNPFDLTRNSGGSSGGSAAAVADGLLPIAGANDGGGSIRIPSAWSGVFGFQPSYGRVPQQGFDLSTFIYESAVARTVEDAALALSVLARTDKGDPFGLTATIDWLSALERPISGMRIGLTVDFGTYPVADEVAKCVTRAAAAFEDQGAQVIPLAIDLPFSHEELTNLWCRFAGVRMVAALELFKSRGVDLAGHHRDDLPTPVWEWIAHGYSATIADLRRDVGMRTAVFDALQGALTDVDLIACPTVTCLPVLNRTDRDTVGPSQIEGKKVNALIGWCPTYLTNFSGHPAASLPAGLVNGLPVGLQLIGRRQGDLELMSACAAFESARPWMKTYEICAQRSLAS
jgi:amidase/aspartyl-tRNA(Asn)/glutamyl-tRNA(Gln) amidotransferase subunit A